MLNSYVSRPTYEWMCSYPYNLSVMEALLCVKDINIE